MGNIKNIEWFKEVILPTLSGYEVDYKFYEQGDLGSLNQIEFNSKVLGGNIDFWGLGWLGIFVWSYEKEEELLNILLEPQQEQEEALKKLQKLLQKI